MITKQVNVPVTAMVFKAGRDTVKIGADTISMTAYSGGLIKGHWYWGNLVIDLDGMSFPKDVYPVLEEHDNAKKIGFVRREQISINGALTIKDATFVDTEASREFRRLSKELFPYQASIYAQPTNIEKLDEDADPIMVNNVEVKGPATIWRQSIFKEASICVFGYDSNTVSKVSGLSSENHLTLSLNITGAVEDPDERLAQKIFERASGQFHQQDPDEEEEILSDEEEAIVERLYNYGAHRAVSEPKASGPDFDALAEYQAKVEKLVEEKAITTGEAEELIDEALASQLLAKASLPVSYQM